MVGNISPSFIVLHYNNKTKMNDKYQILKKTLTNNVALLVD